MVLDWTARLAHSPPPRNGIVEVETHRATYSGDTAALLGADGARKQPHARFTPGPCKPPTPVRTMPP